MTQLADQEVVFMIEKQAHLTGGFIGCGTQFADSRIVVFGAPFDGTVTNRPGARYASSVVRAESHSIETYSPHLDMDLTDPGIAICDAGDLELPFGAPWRVLEIIDNYVSGLYTAGKLPFMIGGEHLLTLGAVQAAARAYPNLSIAQFDAHADLRADYIGETLSHATVMRRCWDILGDSHIFQFAIRSGERHEFEFAEAHTFMGRFDFKKLDDAFQLEHLSPQNPVYLTIDLDVLDPSECPGTGNPEAGGVSYAELLDAARAIIMRCNVVGMDVVELCPPADPSGISATLTCKLMRELLLMWAHSLHR